MKTATTTDELHRALRGRGCKARRLQPMWRFEFGDDLSIGVECLWRLGGSDGLIVTSEDDGHQFGLPAPVDAEKQFNSALEGRVVRDLTIALATSDLAIDFGDGLELEIIATSAGYEAWQIWLNGGLIVAQGGTAL